ncbi:retrovirus-related pol polyprotein from transposon TNT 1-94 [Tanacetum coccineum]
MLRQVSLEDKPIVVLGAIYRTEVCTEKLHKPLAEAKPTENKYRGRGYDRGQDAEQKQVKIMEDRGHKVQAEYHVLELQPEGSLSESVFEACSLQGWFGEAEEAFLHDVREDKETVKVKDVCGEAMKCTFIGNGSDEIQYSFRDTKSHRVIRSKDITFVDSIYGARSATDSSSLTEPIQKSQVVLVGIPENLAENDSIVAEHGLSSEITQSPGGSSYTSDGSKNSGSFEDSGRSDEEYSENGASSREGGSKTPQVRRSNTESRAPWKKDINEEMVSLEKNRMCSLVKISAGKKTSQRLWMFKVKEEQNGRIRYKARVVVKGFQQKWRVDYNEIFSPVVKITTIKLVLRIVAVRAFLCSDMAKFNKPKWQLPLVFEIKDKCSEKHVLSYVLIVGVTTDEYTKSSIHLVKKLKVCSWAKLVRILISEGSLSLLKILGTKSLAEMFTRIPSIESLVALCLVSAACSLCSAVQKACSICSTVQKVRVVALLKGRVRSLQILLETESSEVAQPQVNPDSTIAQVE